MPGVVGVGAGGHAKVVIDILLVKHEIRLVGLVDANPVLWGASVLGVPVLGGDELLATLLHDGVTHAFVGIGSSRTMRPRQRAYLHLRGLGFEIVSAIHPAATISPNATIGGAVTVMAGGIVNAGASLGNNVIVNSGAVVEHDCVIGDHVHLATGVRLAGSVEVGAGSHIGLGAVVRQCCRIGRNVTVGAGAVVVTNVPDNVVVVGVPARVSSHVTTND